MIQDLYKYFRVEARELLEQLGKGVLDLEKNRSPEVVARLLRLAHTLKGASGVVRQAEIAGRAHAIESALAPYREALADLPEEQIGVVRRCVDEIASRVAALGAPEGTPLPVTPEAAASPGLPADEPTRTLRAEITEMDTLLEGIAVAHAQVASLSMTAGVEGVLRSKLEQVSRELEQLRDVAERLRLVPAASLFVPLELVARNTARALGKQVRFKGEGGDVGVDAHVVDAVRGALVQVVRNAVAHGIELPPDRLGAGKPAEGRVAIKVARRGGRVVFTCSDDGRGIDLEAVRDAALRAGRMPADQPRGGREELLRLLLRGGLSTSTVVTEVAGRGVGLDVVRDTTERLGGEASIRTEVGTGTTLELVVPLSLSTLDVLVVETSGARISLPRDSVRAALLLVNEPIARTAQGESIVFEGQAVPLVPLANLLSTTSVSAVTRPPVAVIVRGRDGMAALGVDRLHGVARVALRPLPPLAPATPVVAGTSLDAEGRPQLVLEPDAIVAAARGATVAKLEPETKRPLAPVLIIDDSLTTRMLEQSILESAGYAVELAVSGEEGLEKARRTAYSLFLVDVEMPGMDGFTFIESTRADAVLREIPAILVTSRSAPADRRRGEEVGASGFVVKGEFDQNAVLERIRELVG